MTLRSGPPFSLDSLTAGARRFTRWLAPVRRLWTPLLILWFAGQTYGRISTFIGNHVPIGLDARIYHRAVAHWLAGLDPWRRADVKPGMRRCT
jgi:hypothetical protein